MLEGVQGGESSLFLFKEFVELFLTSLLSQWATKGVASVAV